MTKLDACPPKLCNIVKYWNELLWTEKNYAHNKLVSSAVIRSQNAKIKNKINIHFAFSERPDPHQLKFVQFFSTQPISNYFTLQGYIALPPPWKCKIFINGRRFICADTVSSTILVTIIIQKESILKTFLAHSALAGCGSRRRPHLSQSWQIPLNLVRPLL